MNKKKYGIENLLIWGGCLLGIVSLFLPFCGASASIAGYKVASNSQTLISQPDGMVFLGVFIIIAVLNIFRLNIVITIGSIFAFGCGILDIINVNSQLKSNSFSKYIDVNIGVGAIMLVISGVLILVLSVVAFIKKRNVKKLGSAVAA